MIDIIHGNCEFRVARHTQSILREVSTEHRVEFVDGKNTGSAMDVVSGNAFFQEPLVIFVSNPTKDTDTILSVAEHTGDSLRLILTHSGTIPKNSKLFKVEGVRIAYYQNPTKPWEVKPHAVEFGMLAAKEMGLPISKPLAESLVSRVGSDLATVWWEIKKASMLANLEGSNTIDVQHIKRTMAAISEVTPDALIGPLEMMNAKKFLSAAHRVQKMAGKDPTMWTCAMLSKKVLLWLAVATAVEKSVPLEVVADRLGKNVWYLKNQVLSPARRWGSSGCANLLSALARAEKSVRSGASSPFNSLIFDVAQAMRLSGVSR